MIVRKLTVSTIAALAALVIALPAQAQETPTEEFKALMRCATSLGVFSAYAGSPEDNPTAEDKALATSLKDLEPRLKARFLVVGPSFSDDAMRELVDGNTAEMEARFAPLQNDPQGRQKAVEIFRPMVVACIARGEALPAG